MADDSCRPVSVSRRIDAPAEAVFKVLSDPSRHPRIDGSDMLRGSVGGGVITGVGDVFSMKMHNPEMGDYEMVNYVVEYELNRRIIWEPELSAASRPEDLGDIGVRAGHRWGFELAPEGTDATVVTEIFDCSRAPEWLRTAVRNGDRWRDAMAATLERLAGQCAQE